MDLFRNKENSMITDKEFMHPYQVLTGIDQDEIISPFLWIIYYDLLLTKLQELSPYYMMIVSTKSDIYKKERNESVFYLYMKPK